MQDKKKIDDDIIYIGKKPFKNYEHALFSQFYRKEQKEIKIIARGGNIPRAISIAELAKKRFSVGDSKIKEIIVEISSEKFKKEREGKEISVSVPIIQIKIVKD